jgi:hypothetical protein
MFKIYERLFVGTEIECFENKVGWAIVHACKSPCHQKAVGYRKSLPPSHPNYLVLERGNNLFLNMIDPPQPLFMMSLFTEFLRFCVKHWKNGKSILIHCNKGESRAPSLALLFLAKEIKSIRSASYDQAREDFIKIYTAYTPGTGIQMYLRNNWEKMVI